MVRLFSIRGGGAGGGTIGGASSRFLVSTSLSAAARFGGSSSACGAATARDGAALKGLVRASCWCRFQLLVLDDQELVFADLIPAALLVRLDDFARDGIDQLLAQPVAGFLIDLPE